MQRIVQAGRTPLIGARTERASDKYEAPISVSGSGGVPGRPLVEVGDYAATVLTGAAISSVAAKPFASPVVLFVVEHALVVEVA